MPCVEIEDEPAYSYRGMMLDVSRHFHDVAFVKKQLDIMAMFKLNRFHWHLTNDHLWTIEIKKYPALPKWVQCVVMLTEVTQRFLYTGTD